MLNYLILILQKVKIFLTEITLLLLGKGLTIPVTYSSTSSPFFKIGKYDNDNYGSYPFNRMGHEAIQIEKIYFI